MRLADSAITQDLKMRSIRPIFTLKVRGHSVYNSAGTGRGRGNTGGIFLGNFIAAPIAAGPAQQMHDANLATSRSAPNPADLKQLVTSSFPFALAKQFFNPDIPA